MYIQGEKRLGKNDGEWKTYTDQGEVLQTQIFVDGKVKETKRY